MASTEFDGAGFDAAGLSDCATKGETTTDRQITIWRNIGNLIYHAFLIAPD